MDLEGQTMIRATKGTSLDIWVDGWMDLGKPWGVRNYQKSKKIVCGTHVGFPYDNRIWRMIFERFLKVLGWTFE